MRAGWARLSGVAMNNLCEEGAPMIHVIASIELKPGQRDAYLKEFHLVE